MLSLWFESYRGERNVKFYRISLLYQAKKRYLKSDVLAQSNRDNVCWTGKWIVCTFLQQADNIKKIRLNLNHLVESKCYFFSLAKNFSKEFLFSIMNTFQTNCSPTVKVFIFSKHSILKIYWVLYRIDLLEANGQIISLLGNKSQYAHVSLF